MTKMKRFAAMTAALLISASTMGYLPQDSIIISNVTANAAEEEITSVEINETNFPDEIFRKYVADNFDKDGDGVLSAEEIKYGGVIDVTNMGISDLTGIEYFTDLAFLNCNKNNLTALDVSNNTALEQLGCYENHLTSLDVSNNTALEWLWCNDNQLTTLDLSKNTVLDALNCGNNQFISLDVSNNTTLTNLSCSDNQITSLDLSNNTALTDLYCTRNQLSSLDVTNNTALKYLYCYDNQLSSLNLSNNKLLENLNCDNNNITTLDVSNNKSLVYLICDNNNLTTLDVNNNKKLVLLCCKGNQLTSFDVSNNTSLTAFLCEDNKYEIALTGNTFDLSTLPIEFDVTKASEWTNGTVEGNILTVEDVTKEVTYKYDCGNEYSETFTLISQKKETPVSTTTTVPTTTAPETTTTTTKIYQSVNYSCSLSVYPYNEADTIYEIGEELDLSTICVNGHGKITWDLGTSYSYVDIPYMSLDKCSSVTVDASEFDNTKPGTYTIYVKWYDAVDSFDVTVIDPDNPTAIPGVGIDETNFPDAIFRKYVAEEFDKNKDGRLSDKESADVTDLSLGELGISDLTGIQHFENLFSLWCYDNNLTTLDVSNNTELEILACSNNQLTSLDVSHNTLLTDLMCNNNQLASVDLSNTNCLEGWEFGVNLTNNKHRIKITDNTFDLSTLPTGFDVSKASDWTNATVKGNILTIEDITKEVTYTYNCGLGFSDTFALVPQIEETPAETTTATTTTTETTTTTTTTATTTTPATTTPAGAAPEEELPQTGFSKLYNCIPVSAGALALLGMYAVKKSKKEDEE